MSTPAFGDNIYAMSCPSGMRAMNADAAFPLAPLPVGVEVGGGFRPGVVNTFYFGLIATGEAVSYQPYLACSPPGQIQFLYRGPANATAAGLRTHVQTERLRPGRHVRMWLGCARGGRVVHSGSSVAFFTGHPPARRIVRALHHQHHRGRTRTRTDVTTPARVGDHERVELQVTTLCSR